MAIPVLTPDYAGTATPLTAPTTTQTVAGVTDRDLLEVTVGGTATTITIVTPSSSATGDVVADRVIGPLTSTTRKIRLHRSYQDTTTRLVTINFDQVTAVTAGILR